MLRTSTGKEVQYYLGAITFPNEITISVVTTKDDLVEFYVSDNEMWGIEEKEEYYVGSIPSDNTKSSWDVRGEIIRKFYNSPKISPKAQETIKNYYNDYYQCSKGFEELA